MRRPRSSVPPSLPLALAALLAASCARRPVDRDERCPGCSYLLVTVDTLRPDHTSLYGYARDTTPRLRAFFGDKAVFGNATTTAPCTMPAVMQLLTGDMLSRGPRLAEHLRPRMRTAAVVSQHQFEIFGRESFAAGTELFDVEPRDQVDQHGLSTRPANVVADRAIAWLETLQPGERFFLWLHFFDPHDPYTPPIRLRRWSAPGPPESGDRREMRLEVEAPFSAQTTVALNALYDAEVLFVDEQIGRVLDALAGGGRLERTLVAFTADHGEWLGEGGRWDHCATLEPEELAAPLALSLPASRFPRTFLADAPVSTLDLVPTILGLEGLPLPATLQGKSLLDVPASRTALSAFRLTYRADDGEMVATARAVAPGLPDPLPRADVVAQARGMRLVPLTLTPSRARGHAARSVLHLDLARAERLLAPFVPLRALREADGTAEYVERLRALGYLQE